MHIHTAVVNHIMLCCTATIICVLLHSPFYCPQMEGVLRDERGQEEPRAGGGQQQDLCCWRAGGTGYKKWILL